MRLKKGTKVEVNAQKEVPSGSWRYAEIVGGNGSSYTVRYDGDIGSFGKALVERVPKKAVRPCPPLVDVLEDWMVGDVVEVFDNFSWKMAKVLEVLGWDRVLVRLLGSAVEFKACKSNVRARLCWQNGEWMVIGKASGECEDHRFRLPSSLTYNHQFQKLGANVGQQIKVNDDYTRNTNRAHESHKIPCKTLKRKPSYCHREIEAHAGRYQKIRVQQKHSTWHHFNVIEQPQLPEKVDDVACSQVMLAETSFANKINGYSELNLERERTNGVHGHLSISLESDDDDGVSSSVGSCSVYGNHSHKLHHGFTTNLLKNNNSECRDAESFCQLNSEEGNSFLSAKEVLTEEIHRLELHAYRRIIEALHASGPLSWDLELLLTNLRGSLHISNDEHLMEIRNLVPSSVCIPSS